MTNERTKNYYKSLHNQKSEYFKKQWYILLFHHEIGQV